MTIIISVPAANAALDTMLIDEVSLHSDDPGFTGDNEINSENYTRKPFSFSSATSAKRQANTTAEFQLAAGDTVSWLTYWYQGSFTLAKSVSPALVFNQDGTLVLDDTTALEL